MMPEQMTPYSGAVEYSIPYILSQIALIQSDTSYLSEIIDKLAAMPDGDSGEPGSPGNIQGQAKAAALSDVVKRRELTKQQLLHLYEKMYDDLVARDRA